MGLEQGNPITQELGQAKAMKLTHDQIKSLIERYHSRAKEIYAGSNVSIPSIKHVEIADEGAFVEAMVFIPVSELERRK